MRQMYLFIFTLNDQGFHACFARRSFGDPNQHGFIELEFLEYFLCLTDLPLTPANG